MRLDDDPVVAANVVDSMVSQALARSPRLAALAAAVEAARAGAPAAGALPDPMLGLSARGEDYPGAGIGEDPMAMASVEVSQALPWPGTLGRRQAASEAQVQVAKAERQVARRGVAAAVRAAYAEQIAIDAARAANREAAALVDVLLPAVRTRYETGLAGQADLIGLQLERIRLDADLDDLDARCAEHLAGLAALLDTTTAALPSFAAGLPAVEAAVLPSLEAAAFADVDAAEARRVAARRRAESAEREGAPDLLVGLEYGWRDALPPMLTARVGVELPLWRGRKQDAEARAARHEEAAAAADHRDALVMAKAELTSLRARFDAADRQAARLRDEILPQTRLAVDAARAGYVTGAVNTTDLITALRQLAETRALLAEREADRYVAWATLRALAGRDPVLEESSR